VSTHLGVARHESQLHTQLEGAALQQYKIDAASHRCYRGTPPCGGTRHTIGMLVTPLGPHQHDAPGLPPAQLVAGGDDVIVFLEADELDFHKKSFMVAQLPCNIIPSVIAWP
jgi:hypothetical protein